MKENLKNYVFRLMEEKEYITDQDIMNFRNRIEDIITAETYKSAYKRINYFKDWKFKEVDHRGRLYVGTEDGITWYRIPKEVYQAISNT